MRRFLAATTAVSAVGGLVFDRARRRQAHGRLLDLEVQAETAEVRERLGAAEERAYRHDLINAFAAIEGAVSTLQRQTVDAGGAKVHQLLAAEIDRVRDLLQTGRAAGGRVSLADAAGELAREPAWHDQLRIDVAPDLVAMGSPVETKEAVRHVLGYVSRPATAEPLTVRGQRAGEWVGLWVDDCVRLLPRRQRRALLDLEGDGTLGPHLPLSLHVAARLLRGQDGDLRVEARPDGAFSFGACLPAAPEGRGEAGGPHG
jgi:hypothetical protein